MGFSLFPKTVKFYDLFLEQNGKLQKASKYLDSLLQDFTEVEDKCKYINIVEAEGNQITRKIAKELSLTFITPIDREDIHTINVTQEEVLNLLKAIAVRIGVYDFLRIRYPAQKLVSNLRLMIGEIGDMLAKLSDNKEIDGHVERVKAIKYECETLLLVAIGEAYECEKTFEAVLDIIKWTNIYDRIEQAIDRTEELSNAIEGIRVKHA